MIAGALLVAIAYMSVWVGLIFSVPLWLALLPIFFLIPQSSYRLFSLAILGLGVDSVSAHPMFLLTLMLPLLGVLILSLERLFDKNALFLATLAGTATLFVLLGLVVSRLAGGGSVSVIHVVLTTFSIRTIASIFFGSIAAMFFLHAESSQYELGQLRYD